MPAFSGNGEIQPRVPCHGAHPLLRFGVGAHQHRRIRAVGQPPRQRRRRVHRHRAPRRDGVPEAGRAVQVRIDGDHGVEATRQPAANDALAHGLARVEGGVLAQVAQVGRDQRQAFRAQLTRGGRRELQFDESLVSVGQCPANDDVSRQRFRQADQALAIGEDVQRRLGVLNDGVVLTVL